MNAICEICLCTIPENAGRYSYADGSVSCLSCAMGGEDFSDEPIAEEE